MVSRYACIALALLGGVLQGCATIYLHSDADQKAMDGAATGAEASRQAQLAVLAAHREAMQHLIAAERAAITAENLRLRDSLLAVAINGSAKAAVNQAVEQELRSLTGVNQFPDASRDGRGPGGATSFWNFVTNLSTIKREVAADVRTVRLFEGEAAERGVRILRPCNSRGMGLVVETPTTAEASTSAAALSSLCDDLAASWDDLIRPYATAAAGSPLVACLLGERDSCGTRDRPQKGLLFQATAEAMDVDELISMNAALAKAAEAALGSLEKTYACAVQAESRGQTGTTVADAAALVDAFLQSLPVSPAELSAEANSAASAAPKDTAEAKDCPGGSAAAPSFGELLTKIERHPEDLKKVLDGLAKLEPAESVVAALVDARAGYQESRLAELLQAAANAPATTEAARAGTPGVGIDQVAVAGFVSLLDPLQRLVASQSGDLPETRAILIDLSLARFTRARAAIELDRLKRSRDALQLKADAYLNQSAALARASSAPREEAIVALADSWNRGAIPAAAATVELRGYRYLAWTAEEEAAVEVTYGTIGPLLAELQTYAAGGFTTDEVARALSAVGLVGIAFGAN